jgi:hypothetical protein
VEPRRPATTTVLDGVLAGHANLCAELLVDARRLGRIGQFGPALDQLISRVCACLDEIDELLVILNPVRHASAFATAAALHRELEQIQAAIPSRRRPRANTSKVGGEP